MINIILVFQSCASSIVFSMADLQEPLIRISMPSPQSFVTCAVGEVLHKPEGATCFLPTSLSYQEGEWNWGLNAYATVYDTPITDKIMDAARVVMRDKLEAKVVLPTNMMMLTEQFYLPEWHMSFVKQFVKFNAIYEHWVEVEYGESEDPDEFSTMMKALENWRQTCDAFIVCANFTTNWGIPAFFPVYNMYCTNRYPQQGRAPTHGEGFLIAMRLWVLTLLSTWRAN